MSIIKINFTILLFQDISCAVNLVVFGVHIMSKEDIDLDDDFLSEDADDAETADVDTVKNVLAKRRVIDNILEERRLNKQIADFDFDI